MGEGYDVKLGELEWDFVPKFGDGKITAKLRQLTVLECDTCVTTLGGINRPQMIRYGLLGLTGCSAGGEKITTAAYFNILPTDFFVSVIRFTKISSCGGI